MKRLKISEESIHYFIDRTLNDISLDVDGMKESVESRETYASTIQK